MILYQVENEYGYNTDPTYMEQLERQARADGITVPLTHNHCCGPSTWATGRGAVDLPGQDSYPQGFDCSDPARWSRVVRLPRLRADVPIFAPEFQGGAFDPWGGPGYGRCRALTGPDFETVFYKENIIDGATLQSFYLAYGGTSWGWLATPARVYSSYDYGAAIQEDRELTPKYDEMKRLGLMLASVAPLTKTRRVPAAPATNPAIRVVARANPDDHTHFYELRHARSTSTATDRTHFAIAGYARVPQRPGTTITVAGRDAKLLIAGYAMDGQRLQYSTSELMTHAPIGGRDVALFYGRAGEDGETVLRYSARPKVTVRAGDVRVSWDAARHDLRLDYIHHGLADVAIRPAQGRPLELLLASEAVTAHFWRQDTAAGAVLVRGPELVRTASVHGAALALTGDTSAGCTLTAIAPPAVRTVSWNGRAVAMRRGADGSLNGRLAGPPPVALPALRRWRYRRGSPEAEPGFDDRGWRSADKRVLYADAYGFHHGDVWYRGRFRARGGERGVRLSVITGRGGVYTAWLNGRFLGSSDARSRRFAFPAGSLRRGARQRALGDGRGHGPRRGPLRGRRAQAAARVDRRARSSATALRRAGASRATSAARISPTPCAAR